MGTGVRDTRGAVLGYGFVVLLMASEAALVLPDEGDPAAAVAAFYSAHRVEIILVQIAGLAAAGLLAAYSLRLGAVDPVVGRAGVVTAVLACAPPLATVVLAVVADADDPGAADTWNQLLPRADDLLFVGIVVFAGAIALRWFRVHPRVALLAAVTAALCVARLLLELLGSPRGVVESLGPLGFVVLVGVLATMSATGRLSTAGDGRAPRSTAPDTAAPG